MPADRRPLALVQTWLGGTGEDLNQGLNELLDRLRQAISNVSATGVITFAQSVNYAGGLTITSGVLQVPNGTSLAPSITFDTASGFFRIAPAQIGVVLGQAMYYDFINAGFGLHNVTGNGVYLCEDSAETLGLRRGTNPQILKIYNTYTSSTSNEHLYIGWSSNTLSILTDKGSGGGSQRDMTIGCAAAATLTFYNGGVKWQINSSGHLVAGTDNAVDIGASGATRPRNLYLAGTLTLSGGTLLATSAALTNGAAAQTGTLTNAPAAGNPTKWIPINDNGTTRYIPAW